MKELNRNELKIAGYQLGTKLGLTDELLDKYVEEWIEHQINEWHDHLAVRMRSKKEV